VKSQSPLFSERLASAICDRPRVAQSNEVAWGFSSAANQSAANHDAARQAAAEPAMPGFSPTESTERCTIPAEPDSFFVCSSVGTEDRSQGADPMIVEASVPGPVDRERSLVLGVVTTPDAVHSTLETVLFQDSGPMFNEPSPCDEAIEPTPDEAAPNRSPATTVTRFVRWLPLIDHPSFVFRRLNSM
jgi:hypothetical protein